jgi:hypothetical protein
MEPSILAYLNAWDLRSPVLITTAAIYCGRFADLKKQFFAERLAVLSAKESTFVDSARPQSLAP